MVKLRETELMMRCVRCDGSLESDIVSNIVSAAGATLSDSLSVQVMTSLTAAAVDVRTRVVAGESVNYWIGPNVRVRPSVV